jgi:hypothetical protein
MLWNRIEMLARLYASGNPGKKQLVPLTLVLWLFINIDQPISPAGIWE